MAGALNRVSRKETELNELRHAALVGLQLRVWQIGKYAMLPAIILLGVSGAIRHPCWQSYSIVVGAVLVAVLWYLAYRCSLNDRLDATVMLMGFSCVGYLVLLFLVRQHALPTCIIALMTLLSYLSLHSDRTLRLFVALSGFSFVAVAIVNFLGVVSQVPQTPGLVLVHTIVFIALFFPVIAEFLHKNEHLNQRVFAETVATSDRNMEILEAVGRVQPELQRAVSSIRPMAQAFSSTASGQASTTAEMGVSAEKMAQMVTDTAAAAIEARGLAEQARTDLTQGTDQMRALESSFQTAVGHIESMRERIDQLARELEQTTEINQTIQDIAQSLSMLGLNASLEAARAGENGRGFGVVARELRQTAARSNSDVARVNTILKHVRQEAGVIATEAEASTAELRGSYNALVSVSGLLDGVTTRFAEATSRVEVIAGAAEHQRQGVGQIAAGIVDIAQTAAALSTSGKSLSEGVAHVEEADGQLRSVLGKAEAATS